VSFSLGAILDALEADERAREKSAAKKPELPKGETKPGAGDGEVKIPETGDEADDKPGKKGGAKK
jgi:hypothetical protein